MKPKEMHLIDVTMGARLRFVREVKAVSQQALAKELGVSFQQVGKYERAENRISFSMLVAISRALGVPLAELIGSGF